LAQPDDQGRGRLDRLANRNDESRQSLEEIRDWLAGRGAYVMIAIGAALVIALVIGFAHV
jgi:hypothetical protein